MYKNRPLITPFVAVAAEGYVLVVFCPFLENTSDATIMLELLANESGLRSFFAETMFSSLIKDFDIVLPLY